MSSQLSLLNQVLPTTTGEINLTEVPTEWLIVYFYPKDSTPGCTTQAVGFSCLKDEFDALNTTIFGVSRDSVLPIFFEQQQAHLKAQPQQL